MKHTLIRTLPVIDRRATLRWLAGALAVGQLAACGETFGESAWLAPTPITGNGTGRDPNLLEPAAPWPLTLTQAELLATKALVDLILPAEGDAPAASEVGVPAFIDEWVSAPYPTQQEHRALIVPGLAWLDAEAIARGGKRFALLDAAAMKAIANDIAFGGRLKAGLEKPAEFFSRMRALTMGAYYTTPAGWND
ncbi:MAG: gluconate 2-dehydrogenase subunit 3 family protein, partial [Alphaproteobacteria bacterium]|nr:gluconate 2-dehydrogenase subunit 3 family protein [Alphaproteobacteria bacterium]